MQDEDSSFILFTKLGKLFSMLLRSQHISIKLILLFSGFFLFQQISFGQLVFTSIPSDMQMIPRGQDNLGHFQVSGKSMNVDIESVRIVIRLNSDSTLIYDKDISFDENASFSINLVIPAALADYNLEIYSNHPNHIQLLYKRVKHLVAGDYFIVTGQSNAIGTIGTYEASVIEDSLYSNKFCRTIGNISNLSHNDDSLYSLEKDLIYLLPTTLYWASETAGCIGIWPMRILNAIVKQTGIPVCILNGAVGATELSFHMASKNPSDPAKLRDTLLSSTFYPYDRLFRKLHTHNATSGVKGVFWYQGESDATLSSEEAQTYNKRFGLLRESWKKDYPNLEKIFVFQINTGCAGDYVSIIRDQQRKLSKEFNDVIVLPTVGSTNNDRSKDGCHYTDQGYAQLGENMAPLVLKHLYHFNIEDKYIMGPSIKTIYYSKKNEICLEFDMDIVAQVAQSYTFQNEGVANLADYFYREENIPLKPRRITVENNKIYLTIADTLPAKALTYLPNIFTNIPTSYTGPWILNKNNEKLGALSFYEFPIQPYPNDFWFNNTDYLQVFPNPVTDYLTVRKRNNVTLYQLDLYDAFGNLVLKVPLDDDNSTHIDMAAFESGVYFLKTKSSEGTSHVKIILERNLGK